MGCDRKCFLLWVAKKSESAKPSTSVTKKTVFPLSYNIHTCWVLGTTISKMFMHQWVHMCMEPENIHHCVSVPGAASTRVYSRPSSVMSVWESLWTIESLWLSRSMGNYEKQNIILKQKHY